MDAGDAGGFVRVLARKSDHRVLGIQAVGAHVSELSNAFSLALEMGAVLEDIAGTIHIHPTLGEAFHEAALRAPDGRALYSRPSHTGGDRRGGWWPGMAGRRAAYRSNAPTSAEYAAEAVRGTQSLIAG